MLLLLLRYFLFLHRQKPDKAFFPPHHFPSISSSVPTHQPALPYHTAATNCGGWSLTRDFPPWSVKPTFQTAAQAASPSSRTRLEKSTSCPRLRPWTRSCLASGTICEWQGRKIIIIPSTRRARLVLFSRIRRRGRLWHCWDSGFGFNSLYACQLFFFHMTDWISFFCDLSEILVKKMWTCVFMEIQKLSQYWSCRIVLTNVFIFSVKCTTRLL